MSDAILIEKTSDILIIRFNRPEIRNPLSINILEKLHSLTDKIETDETLKRIIFTGTKNSFASGADLREITLINKETAREFALRGQNLMNKISRLPQTTFAAIDGFCFGGGFDLALACKKRIASPDAKFSHPGARLGIMTGWGGTQRLPRLIGQAKALEIFLTAKTVGAEEALDIGLIDAICENPLAKSLEKISQ